MSSLRRWIGAGVTLALVVSIGAPCLIGQDMTAAQMECCAGTDHECQSMDAEDCCVGSDAQQQPPADRLQPVTSAPVLAFATVPAEAPPPGERLVRNPQGARPFLGFAPVYILLGTLLI